MKKILLHSTETIEYCEKAMPGFTDKLSAKYEFVDSSSQKVDNEWMQKRRAYLRTKILLDSLKSVIEELQFSKDIPRLSVKDQQTVNEINQNF